MRTLNALPGAVGYPVHVGDGLLSRAELYAPYVRNRRILVVSDAAILALYQERLANAIGAFDPLVLPSGEGTKTLHTIERVATHLLERHYGRDSILLALGGGVIGDLTGFMAACYQRGIAYMQLPTTLLAQVDAAIGGKTGVNHPLGKNMVGAFYQPLAVIADASTLISLPEREYRAGLAEVIKYGLIRDAEFYAWLEAHIDALVARDGKTLVHAVECSCMHKIAVVSKDEREHGQRALLNLGHTFGHAIESGEHYRGLLHGEAVGVGLCMAAEFSARMRLLPEADVQRVTRLVAAAGLQCRVPAGLDAATLRACMAVDKKAAAGRLRFVVLDAIGSARVTSEYDEAVLMDTLHAFTVA